MHISSRTPEGDNNRCPVCGHALRLEPSRPPGDAPCPRCGSLVWFRDRSSTQPPIAQQQYPVASDHQYSAGRVPGEQDKEAAHNFLPLSREQEKFLLSLLSSTAYRKYDHNQKNELAFADACRFWDISQNLQGEAVDERLNEVVKGLNDLEQSLAQKDGRLSNGRLIVAVDVRVLKNLHGYMEDRFDRLLNLLRSRSGKR